LKKAKPQGRLVQKNKGDSNKPPLFFEFLFQLLFYHNLFLPQVSDAASVGGFVEQNIDRKSLVTTDVNKP
jgi:hypothetical protein